jgi:hypothetical protein
MAGDGGRAPDVSEQRAVARALADLHGESPRHAMENWGNRARVAIAALDAVRAADPASVLAALLAEQPDATIAALETLLTSDEAVEAAADAFWPLENVRRRARTSCDATAERLGRCLSVAAAESPEGGPRCLSARRSSARPGRTSRASTVACVCRATVTRKRTTS